MDELSVGDLVFFRSVSWLSWFGGFISAVSASHPSGFAHVAIIVSVDPLTIVEATNDHGVVATNLILGWKFFNSLELRYVDIDYEIKNAAGSLAESLIGRGYNHLFYHNSTEGDNQSFYCSQLVQYVYNRASGKEIFSSISMNFPGDYWTSYYAAFDVQVPEGELGSHPGSIYDSEYLIPIC